MFRRSLRRLKAIPPIGGLPSGPAAIQPPPKVKSKHGAGPGRPTPNPFSPEGNIRPSARVRRFTAEHDIAFPTVQRILAGQNFKEFPLRVYVTPRHTFSFYDLKYLDQFEHPLTDKVLDHYAQMKRERPLWSYVQGVAVAGDYKVVVRHASERKVRAALFHALNAAGYDSFGRSRDESKVPLRGTIRVSVLQPKEALKVDFDRMVEYMSKLLGNAMPQLTGQPPRPPPGSRGPPKPKSKPPNPHGPEDSATQRDGQERRQ